MFWVLVLAGLGFYDDYAKILKQSGGGTPPRVKLVTQFSVATFVGIYLWVPASQKRTAFDRDQKRFVTVIWFRC